MFRTIAILAPGLLGSSLGMAIHEKGLASAIHVWARRIEARAECQKEAWATRVFSKMEEAVKKADLVILCAPVDVIPYMASEIAPHLKPETLITDVGSTKGLLCRQIQHSIPHHIHFIGSHPMAGSEKGGFANACVDLFKDKPCLVTPLPESNEEKLQSLIHFWKMLEMNTSILSPEKHDEIVAHISHLPHIVASLICHLLAQKDPQWRHYAGNGLKDSTRVASGSPTLWQSIIQQNREEITKTLAAFEDEIHALRSALVNEDYLQLYSVLNEGKNYRDNLDS